MTDCHRPAQVIDDRLRIEVVANKTKPPLGMELAAVEGDDACRLLAAMLKGVETKRRESRGIRVIENAEYSALFVQSIVTKAKGLDRCRDVYKLVHFSVLYPMSGFRRTEKGVCAKNSSRSCPQARATLADRV
jgi:hypothetical protein